MTDDLNKSTWICKYCQYPFKSKSGMNQHLKTNDKCIEKQKQDGILVEKKCHVCDGCEKEFVSSTTFKYHLNVCKKLLAHSIQQQAKEVFDSQQEVLKTQLEAQQKKLEVLEQELHKIATTKPSHSTTNNRNSHNVTNNNNNNITIHNWMTEEKVMEIFQKNFQRLDQLNPKELANFTVNHLVNGLDRPLYLCTDPSRQRMVYFDGSGNEQVDESCKTLIDKVMQAKPFVDEIIQDDIVDKTEEEIVKVKPFHDAFANLQQSRNYKLELSKQLPRTVESARKQKRVHKPEPDGDGWENGVDWKINEKLRKKDTNANAAAAAAEERKRVIEETENHDVWGFFPQQTDDMEED